MTSRVDGKTYAKAKKTAAAAAYQEELQRRAREAAERREKALGDWAGWYLSLPLNLALRLDNSPGSSFMFLLQNPDVSSHRLSPSSDCDLPSLGAARARS